MALGCATPQYETAGSHVGACSGRATARAFGIPGREQQRASRVYIVAPAPPAVGEGRRVPLYVPYADFFQYQAGAGRLAGRA